MDLPLGLNLRLSSLLKNISAENLNFVVNHSKDDIFHSFSLTLPISEEKINFLRSHIIKDIYSILSILILEASRNSLGKEALYAYLEECMWSKEKLDLFAQFFANHQFFYSKILQHIESVPPKPMCINWKLDYVFKNNNIGEICNQNILIDIKNEVQSHSNLDSVSFSCNLEELQDLVSKLREAVKSVDKLTQL